MRKIMFSVSFFLLCLVAFLPAQPYRVVVGDIPGATENNVKLMKALAEEMKTKIDIEVVPMARMTYLVSNGKADCGIPTIIITNKETIKKLDYDFSNTTNIKLAFVLYSNKSKTIDVNELKSGNPKNYHIESELVNINVLSEFKIFPSTNPGASLKKVDSGLIDGYILAGATADHFLKELKLKNIKRQFYMDVDTGWVLPKGTRGGKLDQFLAEGLKRLKKSGQFNKFYSQSESEYIDWQP